jgi:hypothetical protein
MIGLRESARSRDPIAASRTTGKNATKLEEFFSDLTG